MPPWDVRRGQGLEVAQAQFLVFRQGNIFDCVTRIGAFLFNILEGKRAVLDERGIG